MFLFRKRTIFDRKDVSFLEWRFQTNPSKPKQAELEILEKLLEYPAKTLNVCLY